MTPMKRAAASTPIRSFRRVTAEDGGAPGFVVHRLVQDFARRAMSDERRAQALREALEWVNAAFVGDPDDVRSWPILDPLAPHALAVRAHADAARDRGADRAVVQSNLVFCSKSRRITLEAEPLDRRALAIDEKSYGPDHPDVAIRLNNLAQLFQATNRLAEAEPLMRRALAIDETELWPQIIPTWRSTSTISRCCFRPRTASPKPSR